MDVIDIAFSRQKLSIAVMIQVRPCLHRCLISSHALRDGAKQWLRGRLSKRLLFPSFRDSVRFVLRSRRLLSYSLKDSFHHG